MKIEEVCEAEQDPVSAKCSPEGGKDYIFPLLRGALGC